MKIQFLAQIVSSVVLAAGSESLDDGTPSLLQLRAQHLVTPHQHQVINDRAECRVQSTCRPCSICSSATRADLSNIVANNLGGLGTGPGSDTSGPQEIRYQNAIDLNGRNVDVVLVATGDYSAPTNKNGEIPNGNNGQGFGRVSVETGTSAEFQFLFQDAATGDAVSIPDFALTFYDLDEADEVTRVGETITACNAQEVYITSNTELGYTQDGTCHSVTSSVAGNGQDNPKTATELTMAQADRSVTYEFHSRESITWRAAVTGRRGSHGRPMLFSFEPQVACGASDSDSQCNELCASGSLADVFEQDMVQWQAPEADSTFSSSGSVLSFYPCPRSGNCENNIPVVTADIVLPCKVAVISGSFRQQSTGSNNADDCDVDQAHDNWNPSITGHDGYVMFGTPDQVIYGGCRYGFNFGSEETSVLRTELGIPTNTIRFQGAQSAEDESFDIDMAGLQINLQTNARLPMCASGSLADVFQQDMLQWQALDADSTFSSSGMVLTFYPCPRSGNCENNIPVITADIVLPCNVAVISGSFRQESTGSNGADDGGEPHDNWNPSITGHDGYVMFGTPNQVIYGGGQHGGNFGNEETAVPRTELGMATNTIRIQGAQSARNERFDVDLSGIQINP